MGRIKSALIKRTARTLEKEDYFSEDFERNKKILGSTMPSKSVRNKIAGYIGRLRKMKGAEKALAALAGADKNIQTNEITGEAQQVH